jgi:hypothetical protein
VSGIARKLQGQLGFLTVGGYGEFSRLSGHAAASGNPTGFQREEILMDQQVYVYEGLPTVDGFAGTDVSMEPVQGGVRIRRSSSFPSVFIPTRAPVCPGCKVLADIPLGPFLSSSLVASVDYGGGALNASRALRRYLGSRGLPGAVRLVNTGREPEGLAALCRAEGIELVSLGRQELPVSLIGSLGRDKVIIKEAAGEMPGALDASQTAAIHAAVSGARVVASVSSKDPHAARTFLHAVPREARVIQPTGREETFGLAAESEAMALNFDELCRFAAWARIDAPETSEDSPGAAPLAAELLAELLRRGLAPRAVSLCTLGRHGSVLAAGRLGRIERIALQLLDGQSFPATPSGAGDTFLARWLVHRVEAIAAADPCELAPVTRATREVAELLGLDAGHFEVAATELTADVAACS